MSSLPTYVYPFILAVIAAVVARLMVGRAHDDMRSLPAWILYAVAIGCVILGFVFWWMDHNY